MSEPVAPPPDSSSPRRSRLDRWYGWFGVLRRLTSIMIWGLVAIGLVLRFTVRDRFHPWALFFYVTPIPSLPIWMLLAGTIGSPGRTWRRNTETTRATTWLSPQRLNLIAGLFFTVWTLSSEYLHRAQPPSPQDLRLVFWNVARVQAGVDRLATQLRTFQAPVIGLVEADRKYHVNIDEWQREFPEYEVRPTDFGGLIAVKGKVISQQLHYLTAQSFCEQFDLEIDETHFTVLLVDIASDLLRSRRRPLLALAKLADELADRPVVIMGDFNTPDDSVWMTALQRHHRRAFRERGTGYAATWPMPLPVLTLDQVWVNERVSTSSCEPDWNFLSDHRAVISHVSFARNH